VCKIDPACRNSRADHAIKGFRYYLARPYIVVEEAIPVAANVEVQFVDPAKSVQWKDWLQEVSKSERQGSATMTLSEWNVVKPLLQAGDEPNDESQLGQSRSEADIILAQATVPGAAVGGGGAKASYYDIQQSEIPSPTVITGKVKVVFLPDLDEQYAVNHQNIVATGAYKLIFKDGWQLVSVDGRFDSTQVAVEIVKTVETALSAALKASGSGADAAVGARDVSRTPVRSMRVTTSDAGINLVPVKVTRKQFIVPGVYRINKPWEFAEETAPVDTNCLIDKLGLEIGETVEVEPINLNGTK
jgi:hypothetical protein